MIKRWVAVGLTCVVLLVSSGGIGLADTPMKNPDPNRPVISPRPPAVAYRFEEAKVTILIPKVDNAGNRVGVETVKINVSALGAGRQAAIVTMLENISRALNLID